jgi:hypothetical protein
MSILNKIYRYLIDKTYYGEYKWRNGINKAAIALQKTNPLPLNSNLSKKIFEDLKSKGISTFHINELEGGKELFEGIVAEEKAYHLAQANRIEHQRELLKSNDTKSIEGKIYLVDIPAGEGNPIFALSSAKLALHSSLLSVVNAYIGIYSKVRYLTFWLNLHKPDQKEMASQFWHRDHEDRRILKLFLYLEDVNEGSGPFSYVPGMHRGKLRHIDPIDSTGKTNGTIRANDEAMNKIISKEKWFIGVAPKGTIIIADTKSYHKGGLAKTNDRHLLTAAYYSQDYHEVYLKNGITNIPEAAHPAIKFAAKP